MRRVLLLTGALVVAPVSYTALIVWLAGPVFDATWFFFETMARAQVWALILFSPVIFALKAYEWVRRIT